MWRSLKSILQAWVLYCFLLAPALAQPFNIVTLNAVTNSGTIATSPGTGNVALGASITSPLSLLGAFGSLNITVTGGWSGTIVPEGQSCDAAGTWSTLTVFPVASSTGQTSITANGVYLTTIAGFCAVRARGNTVSTAAATVTLTVSSFAGGGGGSGGGSGISNVNVIQFGSSPVVTGTGTGGAGIPRVTVSNDSSILATPATPANWALGTVGAAVPATALSNAGDAQSSEPSKATTGNLTNIFLDLAGKLVTSPYANRENMLRCAVTLTASTAATTCTGMGAQGASIKIYITDLTCTRSDTGTTSATMTLNDSATTIIDMPNNGGGGGFSHSFNVPLVVAANTAFQVQSGTSLTSVHCSAAGFSGY